MHETHFTNGPIMRVFFIFIFRLAAEDSRWAVVDSVGAELFGISRAALRTDVEQIIVNCVSDVARRSALAAANPRIGPNKKKIIAR